MCLYDLVHSCVCVWGGGGGGCKQGHNFYKLKHISHLSSDYYSFSPITAGSITEIFLDNVKFAINK